jgi:hypothetical protein
MLLMELAECQQHRFWEPLVLEKEPVVGCSRKLRETDTPDLYKLLNAMFRGGGHRIPSKLISKSLRRQVSVDVLHRTSAHMTCLLVLFESKLICPNTLEFESMKQANKRF